ncbi:MAG: PA0069 family radical SAM protein [Rhodobacteraceae bacterium]|nr:PA0069 family radical SAM protein [Paracoccaceae bacterium]
MARNNDPEAARRRGRGATGNPDARFEPYTRVAEHVGWETDEDLPPLRTELAFERPRKIITHNKSPDIFFDRSVNPYRGCEHGCIYCYARPTHAYLGLSPGLDFETKLTAKPEAPAALVRELGRKGYQPAPLALGTNTDPYQPVERDQKITRRLLEVLAAHRHPVTIATKGSLIERDIDILSEMAAVGLVQVGIAVTTLDRDLARRMEPRVPAPARRLAVIRRLAEAAVPVRVMFSPVIPALTDHEIEPVLTAAREAGAQAASWVLLRLPLEVAPLFEAWLATHYPGRASRVLGRVRETQGGRIYDPRFGKRMRGEGAHATLIARRFEVAMARLGLARDLPPLRNDLFRVPQAQLSLF